MRVFVRKHLWFVGVIIWNYTLNHRRFPKHSSNQQNFCSWSFNLRCKCILCIKHWDETGQISKIWKVFDVLFIVQLLMRVLSIQRRSIKWFIAILLWHVGSCCQQFKNAVVGECRLAETGEISWTYWSFRISTTATICERWINEYTIKIEQKSDEVTLIKRNATLAETAEHWSVGGNIRSSTKQFVYQRGSTDRDV